MLNAELEFHRSGYLNNFEGRITRLSGAT